MNSRCTFKSRCTFRVEGNWRSTAADHCGDGTWLLPTSPQTQGTTFILTSQLQCISESMLIIVTRPPQLPLYAMLISLGGHGSPSHNHQHSVPDLRSYPKYTIWSSHPGYLSTPSLPSSQSSSPAVSFQICLPRVQKMITPNLFPWWTQL